MGARRGLFLGVDGGGSKTHAAIADPSGRIVADVRGPASGHSTLGFAGAAQVIRATVDRALAEAGVPGSEIAGAGVFVSGLDLPDETAAVRAELVDAPWAAGGLQVDNDVFALLRSGTSEPVAAAVVCGTGINAAAVGPSGRVGRLLALGRDSGDWGGGFGLAEEVLWHAARAEDGRGEPTVLRQLLLEWTGHASMREVCIAVNRGTLDVTAWIHRVPELIAASTRGDAVARRLVVAQGREVATCARAVIRSAGIAEPTEVPLVLGGGILAGRDPILLDACRAALAEQGLRARIILPEHDPVVGALVLAGAGRWAPAAG